jgi:hypothetical protein
VKNHDVDKKERFDCFNCHAKTKIGMKSKSLLWLFECSVCRFCAFRVAAAFKRHIEVQVMKLSRLLSQASVGQGKCEPWKEVTEAKGVGCRFCGSKAIVDSAKFSADPIK